MGELPSAWSHEDEEDEELSALISKRGRLGSLMEKVGDVHVLILSAGKGFRAPTGGYRPNAALLLHVMVSS